MFTFAFVTSSVSFEHKGQKFSLTWFFNVRQRFKKHFRKIKASRIKPQL